MDNLIEGILDTQNVIISEFLRRLAENVKAYLDAIVLNRWSYKFQQTKEKKSIKVQADDPISFLQLINKADLGAGEVNTWGNVLHVFIIV